MYSIRKLNTGFGVGGKFGFNFGYIHGITFDLMYSNGHQLYDKVENVNNDIDVKWKTYDLYVLYRMYRTINYLELEPKFSKVQSFTNNDVETSQYYVKSLSFCSFRLWLVCFWQENFYRHYRAQIRVCFQ